jgi:hypothetical protein
VGVVRIEDLPRYTYEDDIYRLKGEFKEESFVFDIERCKIDFSFKEVFELL